MRQITKESDVKGNLIGVSHKNADIVLVFEDSFVYYTLSGDYDCYYMNLRDTVPDDNILYDAGLITESEFKARKAKRHEKHTLEWLLYRYRQYEALKLEFDGKPNPLKTHGTIVERILEES